MYLISTLLLTLLTLCTAFTQPQIIVLGVAQDGGYPQPGCEKTCCKKAPINEKRIFRTSLALADPASGKWWLFEATPDIGDQLKLFADLTNHRFNLLPDGIFITHAHIGHYSGLMQLGREVMNTKAIQVHVLPRFAEFLQTNGPWKQLVELNNIHVNNLKADEPFYLTEDIKVTAVPVPHRDEFSETAGFRIVSKEKRWLFIPDIDKWSKWGRDIVEEVRQVNEAYLDATFSDANELPNRNLSEIPHPMVGETMKLFEKEPIELRQRIHFIHLNHTNPLLQDALKQNQLRQKGFNLAVQALK